MPTYVVRVWLPDRPGALGAVASRIGAVRGDLTGIEILERGGGRAIDELEVVLPDAALLGLLVAEMTQVDGVDVEDVREARLDRAEPRVDALETAAVVIEQQSVPDLWLALVDRAGREFEVSWCALIDLEGPALLAGEGPMPSDRWLANFVAGAGSSERVAAGECGPEGVAAAVLAVGDVTVGLVLGREGRPFRGRERAQLAALGRIAESRYLELVRRGPRAAHPSMARHDRRALS